MALQIPRVSASVVVAFALVVFGHPVLALPGDQDPILGRSIRQADAGDNRAAGADPEADGDEAPSGNGCDSEDDEIADVGTAHGKATDGAWAQAQDASNTPDGDKHGTEADERTAGQSDSEDGCGQEADSAEADPDDSPAQEARPSRDTRVDFYRDSQHYRSETITTNNRFMLRNVALNFSRDTVFASDSIGVERSEDTMLSFSTDLTEQVGVGGGLGSVYSPRWSLPVGSFRTTTNLDRATIETGISHDLLAVSAQTIRSLVLQTDGSVNASYGWTDNFVPSLEFHHIDYSDRNSSIGAEFAPQYTFHFDASQIFQVGYHFAYQSFATNLNDGYWAPQRLIANKLASAWIFDRIDYFARLETSLGPESARQIHSEANSPQGGFASSVAATFGLRPAKDAVVECYFAADRTPGWHSSIAGLSLEYLF